MRFRYDTLLALIYKSIIRPFLEFLKDFKSVFIERPDFLVALATIILVLVTVVNVSLNRELADSTKKLADITFDQSKATQEMAEETKRLADITVEQFKIKSYPTFIIEWLEVKLDSGTLSQKYKIQNLGEMTAHKISFLQLFFDSIKIHCVESIFTHEPQRLTSINYEQKICKNTFLTVDNHEALFPKNFTVGQSVILIKFKVPYDSQYRYEAFGFVLENKVNEKSGSSYRWEQINLISLSENINRFLDQLSNYPQPIQSFIADYEP